MRAPREEEPREREEPTAFVRPAEQIIRSRDLTRWGPIWAGLIAAVGTIVLLTTLGSAVGLSFVDAATPQGLTTAAGIWAAIVLLVGLFIGGWLAARTAAVGGAIVGAMHGSMVWALAVFISVILTAIGAAAALGAILGQFGPIIAGQAPPGIAAGATWGLFIALLIGLAVAALGGWIGARSTYEAPPR